MILFDIDFTLSLHVKSLRHYTYKSHPLIRYLSRELIIFYTFENDCP